MRGELDAVTSAGGQRAWECWGGDVDRIDAGRGTKRTWYVQSSSQAKGALS
jgi:hypothetical protein